MPFYRLSDWRIQVHVIPRRAFLKAWYDPTEDADKPWGGVENIDQKRRRATIVFPKSYPECRDLESVVLHELNHIIHHIERPEPVRKRGVLAVDSEAWEENCCDAFAEIVRMARRGK